MDPLTITSAAAIVSTTLQVVQTCNEYYMKYKAVDLQLVCMQTQCSIIEVALLQIQDVIVHDSARFERLRSLSVLASNYERTLGACQIVFAILRERLNKLNGHLRNNCGKLDWQLKLKVVWNDQESAMLLKNIEGQASAISLLLNAIQMKTQVEMLGLLTRKESRSILKTASEDADTLSLVHENASAGLPDGESVITSKLDDTEFDFDLEIINTAAYRKVFNKARSKLPPKKGSQAVIPPYAPTSSGVGASETANLPSINASAAIHSVVASQKNNFSSSRPNASSREIGFSSVLPKDSAEGARDGFGGMREEQHDAGLEEQPKSTSKRREFRFRGYNIGTTIGAGRKSSVRLAWKEDSAHPLAIKFISGASDTNHSQKILHGFVILRGISHPNIIRLHDLFEFPNEIMVVLGYNPGGSLAEYVSTPTRLSDHVYQKFFAQIISAVGYLHRNGVVHLGLSCSEVLLDSNQNAILTGFSNARTFDTKDTAINSKFVKVENLELFAKECGFDRRDKRGFMRGDLMEDRLEEPYYSAPEASLYRLYEGRKADVWSCGIMLYFMLAGNLPFTADPTVARADDALLLLEYICNKPLTFPEYFSPQARDLVKRMVVVRPQNRADLGEAARHGWLLDYAHLLSDWWRF